ncbi:hypothetical protein GCM10027290_21070 [Micromonospora sonneratiae]|uniref:Uncharacterized protein n=1 Tax=Micromonospora sonneratiae TaxID=1184706 RepID=A0ABW3YF27_9ACTN
MRNSITRRVARLALALVAVTGLSMTVTPAAPAAAACGSTVFAKYNTLNGSIVGGWKLMQNSACTERWGQIVVDYAPDPTGLPYAVMVERQIKTPYGYYTDVAYTKVSGIGAEGTWNTTHTPNSSGENDKHRICWGWGNHSGNPPSTWSGCSDWYFG